MKEEMKRTPNEISEAIQLLTKLLQKMPRYSYFNDDNHAVIQGQVDVLNGVIAPRSFDKYSFYDQLELVYEWMNGASNGFLEDLRDDVENFSN